MAEGWSGLCRPLVVREFLSLELGHADGQEEGLSDGGGEASSNEQGSACGAFEFTQIESRDQDVRKTPPLLGCKFVVRRRPCSPTDK